MQIQVISDLHLEVERSGSEPGLEFYHYDIPVKSERLALLGDIGCTIDDKLFDWLRIQLRRFKIIFFVSGNHEPYRSTVEESARRLSDFATETNANSSLGKFIYLNRTRYDVSETLTILGCTLWSALNPEDLDILSWSITDFRRIDSFNPEAYSALHRGDLDWLNNTVSSIAKDEPHRKVVIFTHHAPTKDGTGNPKFNDGPTNSAFATELSSEPCWDSKVVKTWAFGHTHWCCNFEKGGIMVYANQRGYGDGAAGYNVETVLDL